MRRIWSGWQTRRVADSQHRCRSCHSYFNAYAHTPYDPPQEYAALYEETDLKPPEYWGAVTAIDACVGRLMEKLDALGLRDHTLVIFTSDHGDHFGLRPGGSAHKEVPYDDAARVPLILRLPGMFEGGKVRSELASNVDLMPTILDVAGVAAPPGLQGASLVPLSRGEAKGWRTLVCTENGKGATAQTGADSRGIRTDRYKLILRQKVGKGVPGLYELYDLETDPLEKTNLFSQGQADIIRGILDPFEAWAKSTGDALGLEMAAKCRKSLEERQGRAPSSSLPFPHSPV